MANSRYRNDHPPPPRERHSTRERSDVLRLPRRWRLHRISAPRSLLCLQDFGLFFFFFFARPPQVVILYLSGYGVFRPGSEPFCDNSNQEAIKTIYIYIFFFTRMYIRIRLRYNDGVACLYLLLFDTCVRRRRVYSAVLCTGTFWCKFRTLWLFLPVRRPEGYTPRGDVRRPVDPAGKTDVSPSVRKFSVNIFQRAANPNRSTGIISLTFRACTMCQTHPVRAYTPFVYVPVPSDLRVSISMCVPIWPRSRLNIRYIW